jgi:hypothetical protein
MKTQTAMQLHKKIIQNVIESMNGELNSYQSGYKQCLIQVQNDIDETLLRLEKEQIIDAYNNGDLRSADLYYNETYGGDK